MSSKSALVRWRVFILLAWLSLALSACDAIQPSDDTFTTAEGFQTWSCNVATSLRGVFFSLGFLLATFGIFGYGIKTLAPSFFGDFFGGIAGNIKNILVGSFAIGFGPMIIAQAFISMGGSAC